MLENKGKIWPRGKISIYLAFIDFFWFVCFLNNQLKFFFTFQRVALLPWILVQLSMYQAGKAPGVFIAGAKEKKKKKRTRLTKYERDRGKFSRALHGRQAKLITYVDGTWYRPTFCPLVLADHSLSLDVETLKPEWTSPSLRSQCSTRKLRAAINLEKPPNTVFSWDLWEALEACSLLVTTPRPWLLWMKQSQRKQCWWLSTDRTSPVVSQSKLINNCSNLQAHEAGLSEINKCPERSPQEEGLIFWERMERVEGQKELLSEATFLTNLFRISSSHTCEKWHLRARGNSSEIKQVESI